jgi:hypothetical protein
MIETLGTVVLQEVAGTYDLSVTGIKFRDSDLSKPLYPSLIDDSRAPQGIQFDPGVQSRSLIPRPLTFLFQIDPAANVRFQSGATPDAPVIQSVAAMPGFGFIPGLQSAVLLDSTTCQLTWNQSVALFDVTALRLCCEPTNRLPTDPERVDGGIYLAIIHREEPGKQVQGADRGPIARTIQILGSDEHGRPIYDLYFRDALASLPEDLSFEPCYRVREGQTASFDMLLSLSLGDDIEFEASSSSSGQVAIQPYQPREWPSQLHDAGRSDLGKKCSLEWVQNLGRSACRISDPEKGRAYCMAGYVTSFYLDVVKNGGSELAKRQAQTHRTKHFQVDPTVIQPPSCTADGICITP